MGVKTALEPVRPIWFTRVTSNLNPASEGPGTVVGLRTVVSHEDAAVTAIPIKRSAELADLRRRFHPARGLGIVVPKLLQLEILLLG